MSVARVPILHVDDDQNDIILLEHACRAADLGFLVKSATDGEMAVNYLQGAGAYADRGQYPVPQLILLDLKMPRKTGFEVLNWIRGQPTLKRILVFIFTSSRHQEDVDRAYELGANAYLVKPVGFERLVEELKALNNWLALNEKPTLQCALQGCAPHVAHGILPA